MSIEATTAVWQHSLAMGGSLLTLLAIADCQNEATQTAWPSVAHLVRKTRLHRATVLRAIKELRACGELGCELRPGQPTLYHVLVGGRTTRLVAPCDPSQEATAPVALDPSTSRTMRPRTGRTVKEPSVTFPKPWKTVPAGELLTPERRAMGPPLGLAATDVGQEWEKFIDWEFKSTHVSVDRTWRNWIREAVVRRKRNGTPTPNGPARIVPSAAATRALLSRL